MHKILAIQTTTNFKLNIAWWVSIGLGLRFLAWVDLSVRIQIPLTDGGVGFACDTLTLSRTKEGKKS